jgi:hypothetical protein
MTTVIHVRDARPGDYYVGRPNSRVPDGVIQVTELGNPFHLVRDGDRAGVIAACRQRILQSPHLLRLLPQLRGKRIACWCKPKYDCHADIYVDLLDRYTDAEIIAMAEALEARWAAITGGKP